MSLQGFSKRKGQPARIFNSKPSYVSLDITLTDNVLTIKGEVKADEVSENEQYHLRERRYGSFSRSLSLPVPVVAEEIEASYENGILTLTIPKAEEVKPKRIAVKAHGNGSRAIEGQFSQS